MGGYTTLELLGYIFYAHPLSYWGGVQKVHGKFGGRYLKTKINHQMGQTIYNLGIIYG